MMKYDKIGSKRYNVIHTNVIDEHSIIQTIISNNAKKSTSEQNAIILGVTINTIINNVIDPLRNSLGDSNVSEVYYSENGALVRIFNQWIKLVSIYDLRLNGNRLKDSIDINYPKLRNNVSGYELDYVYALSMDHYSYNGFSDVDIMNDIDKILKQRTGRFYGQVSGLSVGSWIFDRVNNYDDIFITGCLGDDEMYGFNNK